MNGSYAAVIQCAALLDDVALERDGRAERIGDDLRPDAGGAGRQ